MIGLKAMQIALGQDGVTEQTNHNDGRQVEQYLKSVGLGKGYSWCMAFVYWCVSQVTIDMNTDNPLKCTGGVLAQWNAKTALRVKDPVPGDIFIMDYGKGLGHTGFVTAVRGEWLDTIEGNTNQGGSRNGDGVYRRTRKVSGMKGFLRI